MPDSVPRLDGNVALVKPSRSVCRKDDNMHNFIETLAGLNWPCLQCDRLRLLDNCWLVATDTLVLHLKIAKSRFGVSGSGLWHIIGHR